MALNSSRKELKSSGILIQPAISRQEMLIQHFVQPESELEQEIIKDNAWIEGAFWGKPRPGHPEGKVLYHVREVLGNVDKISTDPLTRHRLRMTAIIHDTFKYQEEQTRPRRDWSKHHAVYAANFAKKYTSDKVLIDLIELHDEVYYAWCALHYHFKEEKAAACLERVYSRLEEEMQLYYLFFKCDTQTGDKTQAPVRWFERTIKGIEVLNF